MRAIFTRRYNAFDAAGMILCVLLLQDYGWLALIIGAIVTGVVSVAGEETWLPGEYE